MPVTVIHLEIPLYSSGPILYIQDDVMSSLVSDLSEGFLVFPKGLLLYISVFRVSDNRVVPLH